MTKAVEKIDRFLKRRKVRFWIRNYFIHLIVNWKVAGKSLLMFLFHFIHGVVPVKYTSHKYWNISLSEKGGK
jgi:hypothetical protein